jgi:hypothetical protein
MLKIIYGNPKIYIYERRQTARIFETFLKQYFEQIHCWIGLQGKDRNEISKGIIQEFKSTNHYKSILVKDKEEFENYLSNVYFAKRVHPRNPKRTFYWGDSLEPKFLRVINCGNYEQTIEKVLNVKY